MAKVIPIASVASKQKALDDLWEFNNWLVYPVGHSETLQEFVESDGYFTLEDLLADNYGYQGERLEKAIFLIKQYYQTIRPGDVKVGNNKVKVAGCIHAELYCPDGGDRYGNDCFIVATKF